MMISNARNQTDSHIFYYKSKILEKLKFNQVLIIVGQTGCGKSTQVPQYLYQSGYSKNGIIACLHPRCVAARTLAERVSYETKTELGTLIGYNVRFSSVWNEYTKILYMTTGYMLRILRDNDAINQFSVIIIDEAHERSAENDLLMGKMKMIMNKNIFVKLIIMSATLNVKEIQKYYPGSATIMIKEFLTEVEIIYHPLKTGYYISTIKDVVEDILKSSKYGHILIFLPTEQKVRKCKNILKDFKNTVVLSFYAAMDDDDKMMVFKEFGGRRKIIVSTNIAETSLTIEGVDFVIDSGYVKRVKYDHENMVEKWITEPISIAEANQRAGRTGRTGFGKCYRLYKDPNVCEQNKVLVEKETKKSKNSIKDKQRLLSKSKHISSTDSKLETNKQQIPDYPVPEIKNVNLSGIILTIKYMDIQDINNFPFIVMPDLKSVEASIHKLKELSLLNNDGTINKLGKEVSNIPLDPSFGKVAVIGSQLPCRSEIFTIVALLSVVNIFKDPTGKLSKECHQKFNSIHGDLFSLLNVYEAAMAHRCSREWCKDNYINFSCLKYARLVAKQLNYLLPPSSKRNADLSKSKENQIKKAFLSGFFLNIARPIDGVYHTCKDKPVTFYKGTCLGECKDLVLGTTMLQSSNSKNYVLKNCITLKEDMLKAFVPEKYKIKITLWREVIIKLDQKERVD